MKRFISLVLSAMMLLSCITIVSATDSGTISVGDGKAVVGTATTVEIPISISNNPGIQALDIQITFNSTYLTLTNVADTGLFDDSMHGTSYSSPYHLTWNNIKNNSPTDWVADGVLAKLTFDVSDKAPGGELSIQCQVVSAYKADETNLKGSLTTSNGIITVTEAPKKEFTNTLESQTVTYNGSKYSATITGTLPEGTSVTYTYKDSNGQELSSAPKDAGTYTVTATLSGAGYETKTLTNTLTIEPKELTVTGLTAENKTYDGTDVATVTGGELSGVVTGDVVTATFPTIGKFESKDAGNNIRVSIASITLDGTDKDNYKLTPPTLTANINKVSITVTAENATKVAGDKDPELKYSYTNVLVGSDTFTGALTRKAGEEPGTYQILQGTLKLTDNYEITFVPGTFTITEAKVTALTLKTFPTKTDYKVGENFNPAGMVLTATYENGNTEDISTGFTCEPATMTKETTFVTVSYGGQSVTVPVTVTEDETPETYTIRVSYGEHGKIEGDTTVEAGKDATFKIVPDEGYEVADVVVNGKSVGAVTTYTFKEVSSNDNSITATFQKTAPTKLPFTDVPEDAYYYNAVKWAVENNVAKGITETTFVPEGTCTRAQVVTFLWRAAGEPAPKTTKNPFTDVKSGAYYYDAVLWAVENNITNGMSATTFAPDDPCTRAQVVTFLWRSVGKPAPITNKTAFTDVKPSAYYYDAVLWAVENNITNGISAATFGPDGTCIRAQIVTFLYRKYVG